MCIFSWIRIRNVGNCYIYISLCWRVWRIVMDKSMRIQVLSYYVGTAVGFDAPSFYQEYFNRSLWAVRRLQTSAVNISIIKHDGIKTSDRNSNQICNRTLDHYLFHCGIHHLFYSSPRTVDTKPLKTFQVLKANGNYLYFYICIVWGDILP